MATNVNLPKGFVLDANTEKPNLPNGFVLDNSVPESKSATEIAGKSALDMAINPVKPLLTKGAQQFGRNAIRDVGDISKGIGTIGMQAVNVFNPIPKENTIAQIAEATKQAYGKGGVAEIANEAILQPTKEIAKGVWNDVRHPVTAFRERPVSFAMNVLPTAKGGVKIAELASRAAPPVVKKAASLAFGPSVEAIGARLANPEAINGAKTFAQIADDVPATLDKLKEKIGYLDTDAWNALSKSKEISEGAVLKDSVKDIIQFAKKEIGPVVGRSDEMAMKVLKGLEENINNLKGDAISEYDLKPIVRKLDDNINWENPEAKTANEALKTIRHHLDTMLKDQNMPYANAMIPVDENVRLLKDAEKLFAVKKSAGHGYAPTDTTINKISNLKREGKDISKRTLDELKRATGDDYVTSAHNAEMAREFERPTTHGSRRTMLGGIVGGTLGLATGSPKLGAMAGGLAGYIADIEGGKILGKGIDSYVKTKRTIKDFVKQGARK